MLDLEIIKLIETELTPMTDLEGFTRDAIGVLRAVRSEHEHFDALVDKIQEAQRLLLEAHRAEAAVLRDEIASLSRQIGRAM